MICIYVEAGGVTKEFKGSLFASPEAGGMFVLRSSPAHTYQKADYLFVPEMHGSRWHFEGDRPASMPSPPQVGHRIVEQRMKKSLERHIKAVKRQGRNVTEWEQAFFNALLPNFPEACWGDGDGAIWVMGDTTLGLRREAEYSVDVEDMDVTPPKTESLRLAREENIFPRLRDAVARALGKVGRRQ